MQQYPKPKLIRIITTMTIDFSFQDYLIRFRFNFRPVSVYRDLRLTSDGLRAEAISYPTETGDRDLPEPIQSH